MDNPRISVIIPAYNRGHLIGRAITCALQQTFKSIEVLVVDDASTDETAELVRAFGDSRVKLLRHDRNRGAANARNSGVMASAGEWIAFLDSDDEWHPRKLELQLQGLDRYPTKVSGSVTGYRLLDARVGKERVLRPTDNLATHAAQVWGCSLSPGSTLMVSREDFLATGYFDTSLRRLEDWEWMMRFTRHHSLCVLPDPLVTIHKSNNPSSADVISSVAILRTRHRDYWYDRSWIEGRKFDSTLFVEEAAGAFYDRNGRRAAELVIRAIITYPFRRFDFYAMLMQRTFSSFQRLAQRLFRLGSRQYRARESRP